MAPEPGHGGGQPKRYTQVEQERIPREVRRAPNRDMDKTADGEETLTPEERRPRLGCSAL